MEEVAIAGGEERKGRNAMSANVGGGGAEWEGGRVSAREVGTARAVDAD
jgi:hypothetical protein